MPTDPTYEELQAIFGDQGAEQPSAQPSESQTSYQPSYEELKEIFEPSATSDAKKMALGFMTGVGKGVPFGQDIPAVIGAGLSEIGMGPKYVPTEGTFRERYQAAKKAQEAAYEKAQKEAPLSSVAGTLTGITGTLPAFEMAAPAEAAFASKAVPALEQTLGRVPFLGKRLLEPVTEIGGQGLRGGWQGAVYGAGGEGDTLEERLKHAKEEGITGMKIGAALPALGRAFGMKPLTEAEKYAIELEAPIPATIGHTSIAPKLVSEALGVSPLTKGIVESEIKKQKEKLGEALMEKGDFLGGLSNRTAGDVAKNSLLDWVNVEFRDKSRDLYDKVEKTVNASTYGHSILSPIDETKKIYDNIGAERLEAALGKNSPAMKKLNKAVFRTGMTFNGIKRLRTEVGEILAKMQMKKTPGQAEVSRFYDSLTQDLGNAAENAGGIAGRDAFEHATSEYNKLSEKRDKIFDIIGRHAESSPESIFETLSNAARRQGGNSDLLQHAREVMTPDAWRHVASRAVENLGKKGGAEFKVTDYVKGYQNLSPEGKDLLFGPAGNLQRDTFDKLYKVSKAYVDREQGAHYSKLSLAALSGLAAAIGGTLGAGTTLLAHPIASLAATAVGGLATIPLAHIMSNPRIGGLYVDYLNNPTKATLKRFIDAGKIYAMEQANEPTKKREQRSTGGKISKRDYPAKRLTRMERAAKWAHDAIALETKPIMEMPDEQVVDALRLAKDK